MNYIMTKRYFTVVDFPKKDNTFGRYKGVRPCDAASKAFSQLARIVNLKNSNKKNHMVFTIKEISQGGSGKCYTYIGTRVELDQPIMKNIGGKNVYFKHKNIISKYDDIK